MVEAASAPSRLNRTGNLRTGLMPSLGPGSVMPLITIDEEVFCVCPPVLFPAFEELRAPQPDSEGEPGTSDTSFSARSAVALPSANAQALTTVISTPCTQVLWAMSVLRGTRRGVGFAPPVAGPVRGCEHGPPKPEHVREVE